VLLVEPSLVTLTALLVNVGAVPDFATAEAAVWASLRRGGT
jgi:hypothetical protein